MLLAHLAEQVAGVLRIPAERVEPTTTLSTLGLDSLTALEFRNRLEVSLGVALRATLVWAHPTTGALAEFVAKQLGVDLAVAPDGAVDDDDPVSTGQAAIAADIERMSDAEAEMALLGALDALEGAE
jgi:acyl carrier protein